MGERAGFKILVRNVTLLVEGTIHTTRRKYPFGPSPRQLLMMEIAAAEIREGRLLAARLPIDRRTTSSLFQDTAGQLPRRKQTQGGVIVQVTANQQTWVANPHLELQC